MNPLIRALILGSADQELSAESLAELEVDTNPALNYTLTTTLSLTLTLALT